MPKRINISDDAASSLETIPGMKKIIEEHGISYGVEFVIAKYLGREVPLTPKELKSIAAQERWDNAKGKQNAEKH